MNASDIMLLGFGCLAIVPVVLLFTETYRRLGLSRASLTLFALVGFVVSALLSIHLFGIWVVLIFPILLFAGLFLLKKKQKTDNPLDNNH